MTMLRHLLYFALGEWQLECRKSYVCLIVTIDDPTEESYWLPLVAV
jgi:hypothetical protein